MKYGFSVLIILTLLVSACQHKSETAIAKSNETVNQVKFQNDAHKMVYDMVQKVGTYDQLKNLNDVSYTYTYTTPDGKKDVSTEKYIFDGELSYAQYTTHQRSSPELEGPFEQGYDGSSAWFKHNGEYLMEDKKLEKALFNRKTNFYWFSMMQKLTDPGLNYSYVRLDTIGNSTYDVVNVTFQSDNNKPTDTYQLFINKKTSLVDQFLFTVADFNVMDTPFLMKVTYEKIDGVMVPSQRKYAKSDWQAGDPTTPWIMVTWSDIKFNQGLDKSLFLRK